MTERALFFWSAAGALALHAALLLITDGVHGGGDLKPHLRLIQLMGEEPGLRSVYAPAYHLLGALASPLVGLGAYSEWFAWGSALALIASFRMLQRASGLPDTCAALFAWSPYLFALTRCLPKVEAAGYAIALVGLALLLSRRHVGVALCLVGAFAVHTAAALLLGLIGGVLALSRREPRALAALAAGTLLALPLPLAHVADGCTWAQALLFSHADYLRGAPRSYELAHWGRVLLLANPIALVAAGCGARALWQQQRGVALVSGLIVLLYLNELWLAPFGGRTTLDLMRGLTLLAIPLALAGGVALADRPALAKGVVAASALLALATSLFVVPAACVSKPIDVAEIQSFSVDRCVFRWRYRQPRLRRGTQRDELSAYAGVDRPTALESAPQ